MKVGNRLIAKNTEFMHSGEVFLKKNERYTVIANDKYHFIIHSEFSTFHLLRYTDIKKYFYTEKEYRLQKLNKINGTIHML